MALVKKITRVGNSTAIIIPKPLTKILDMEIGAWVQLSVEDGALVIRRWPVAEPEPLGAK